MKAYHNWKVLLVEEIRTAKSNIYFFFDFWISSNSLAFVTIVAHFIDNSTCFCIMLTGFHQVIGLYVEEVIAEQRIEIIQEYNFQKWLWYFILDNATSNNTCIETIVYQL